MKGTVTKTTKKAGTAAAPDGARKVGMVKAVASALAKKITDALTPAKKVTAAAKPSPAARKAAPKAAAKALPATKKTATKTATKAATKAATKEVTKAATTTVKKTAASTAAKPAAKTGAKVVAKVTSKVAPQARSAPAPVPQADEASMKKAAQQQAARASESGAHTTGVAGATAESADKMKPSVVSKVSEVMTKTSKSTPAQNADGRVISEDEIRSMGDKDYMNPAQLAFFKTRLQQLEKDLLKNAGETTEHLRETVLVPDPADRATIEEEHALELRTRDRERKLLKKVQQSRAAIDGGDYGWCEETGEPIGIPRLIARPTATLSLEAQQRRELKQKLYGD